MSDAAEGPGWWLASDGKWYPPTAVPGYATADSEGPLLSPTVWRWTARILVAVAFYNVAITAVNRVSVRRLDGWLEAQAGRDAAALDAYESWVSVATIVDRSGWVVAFVPFVAFMVWMRTAHEATSTLNPTARKWRAGWTIGGWFVPVGNMFIPKLVLNEMERLTRSVRDPQAAGTDWRVLSTMPIGWVWWLLWLLSAAIAGVAFYAFASPEELSRSVDPIRFRAPLIVASVATAVEAIALVAGARYVRALSRSINGEI